MEELIYKYLDAYYGVIRFGKGIYVSNINSEVPTSSSMVQRELNIIFGLPHESYSKGVGLRLCPELIEWIEKKKNKLIKYDARINS